MRTYPTIAVIEFSSIADGIYCTDALLKKAPITMLKSGTVSRGRYLTMIGGTTSWVGPPVGALLLGTLQQLATVTISSAVSLLIVGLLLVFFVIIAPNGNGVAEFEFALRKGRSGLKICGSGYA